MDGQNRPEQIIPSPEQANSPEQAELLDSRKLIQEVNKEAETSTQASPVLPELTNQATPINEQQVILAKVEAILAADMEKIFLSMDLSTQAKFKAKGEEVAIEISSLFQKTRVQLKKVINLISEWLRLIPNVNKYYLEQEAKLKADALLRLYKNGTDQH